MTGVGENAVEASRPPRRAIRVRLEFLSGPALGKLAARLASRPAGPDPEKAAELLRRLGRRGSA